MTRDAPSRYLDRVENVSILRDQLNESASAAIARDPVGALPAIVAIQKDTEQYLRDAVRSAARTSSWREIAEALGTSRQAAHQRFRAYVGDAAVQMKAEHRAMKKARRIGDHAAAEQARARRDALAAGVRSAAEAMKTNS